MPRIPRHASRTRPVAVAHASRTGRQWLGLAIVVGGAWLSLGHLLQAMAAR